MIKSKRGQGISVKNLLGLLIAVVILIILASLLFKILAPTYDEADEIGKSYYEMMKNSFEEAEENGYALLDFFVRPTDDARYFLVHFDGNQIYDNEYYDQENKGRWETGWTGSWTRTTSHHYKTDFFLGREARNTVCICYTEKDDAEEFNRLEDHEVNVFYSSEGKCERCLDLDWPLEFNMAGGVVLLDKNSDFIIRFTKGEDSVSKFLIEKNDT